MVKLKTLFLIAQIPNGVVVADVKNTAAGAPVNVNGLQRVCGRIFNNAQNTAAPSISICSESFAEGRTQY
jgi:hypothetical protein